MLSGFLKREPLLDEPSILWIFDLFAWSFRNFDAEVFYNETILVTPSNAHFPGRVDSVHGMASLIFEQVKEYAGVAHWPCQLVDHNSCRLTAAPHKLLVEGALRGAKGIAPADVAEHDLLTITYDPNQVNNPEALIASYAHTFAHYLGSTAREMPPAGEDNWPHLTEILAVFMGFGLMFANSALVVHTGGCSSCGNPAAERSGFLSQYDLTYALALFCVLKEIPVAKVTPHLKKSLRTWYKKAVKDIQGRQDELNMLKSIPHSHG